MKFFFYILCIAGLLYAQDDPAKLVSDHEIDSLRTEADAIVLTDEATATIDDSEIEYKVHRKILINNKDGKKYGIRVLHESEFMSVKDIESSIQDVFGKVIRELEDDDIDEFTLAAGYTEKYKRFEAGSTTYPYIVEYSYTYEYESHYFWRDWYPQKDIPVLSSTYKLILEDDIPYNTYKIGLNIEPKKYTEDGNTVHLYALKNIPPTKDESRLPTEFKTQNAILFAPQHFRLGESHGSCQTWDEFASWYRLLAKDRYRLSENTKMEINNLVTNEEDPYKKIDLLYKYLQDKTRYVQIYLNLGGVQPHPADWVYQNRFGDCKDLATFMITLLKIAGIKAYPALVRTKNSGYVYKDFPSDQFNHIITFIPLNNDSLWLDCTFDYISYRDTPYWIEGTNALVVKENKGEILTVHQRNAAENLHKTFFKGDLDTKSTLSCSGQMAYTGGLKNDYKEDIAELKSDELKRMLIKTFTKYQQHFNLDDFEVIQENRIDPLKLNFKGEYKRFVRKVGKRLFFNPNLLNRETQKYVPEEETRTYPFDLVKFPYLDIDSLEIKLPGNYTIESAPEMKNLKKPFGKYITRYKIENGVFHYYRLFEYSKELIYPEEYNDFLEFYKTVVDNDNSKFVLSEL